MATAETWIKPYTGKTRKAKKAEAALALKLEQVKHALVDREMRETFLTELCSSVPEGNGAYAGKKGSTLRPSLAAITGQLKKSLYAKPRRKDELKKLTAKNKQWLGE